MPTVKGKSSKPLRVHSKWPFCIRLLRAFHAVQFKETMACRDLKLECDNQGISRDIPEVVKILPHSKETDKPVRKTANAYTTLYSSQSKHEDI